MSEFTAQRHSARDQYVALAKTGPGWNPYVIVEAERLVREDPILHGGIVALIESEIGPDATKAARSAIEWFRRNP